MSIRLSPAPSRSKLQRAIGGEIDTTPPFQSVKAAVNMFGDKGPKPTEHKSPRPSSAERRFNTSRGMELQHVQEELARTKEQLASADKMKAQALQELVLNKRLVGELTIKFNEAVDSARRERLRAEEMEHASFTAAEDWQVELEAMNRQYEAEVIDLQNTKKALENLKQELLASMDAKDEAMRLAGEAMTAAEAATKRAEQLSIELIAAKRTLGSADITGNRVDELMAELAASKQALVQAHTAHEKTIQEGTAVLAAKEAELKETAEAARHAREEVESLKRELDLGREYGLKLTNASLALENLKVELATAKEVETKMIVAALNAKSNLERLNEELKQTKRSESEAVASLAAISAELEEIRENLNRKTADEANLASSLEFVKMEFDRNCKQLSELKDQGSNATAKVSALYSELIQVKQDLKQAVTAETKAEESLKSLSFSLQLSIAEADAARQEACAARDESQRARREAAAAQAESHAANHELQSLIEQVERVKAEFQAARSEAQKAKSDALAARNESQLARIEAEVIIAEAQAAREDARLAREEDQEARSEVQAARLEIQAAKSEAQVERERANSAIEETQVALDKIEELKAEVNQAHACAEQAAASIKDLESRLQDALRKIETDNVKASGIKHKNGELSAETLEMVEVDPDFGIIMSQQEYDLLKVKLQEAGNLVASAMAEVEANKLSKEELSRKLDAAKIEIEVIKMATLRLQQQFEDAEKAKSVLLAEVQRLTALLKADGAVEPPLNTEINGSSISFMFEEEKFQQDSLRQVLNMNLLTLHKEEEERYAESPPLTSKKKKKALLLKIGTYLTKKK